MYLLPEKKKRIENTKASDNKNGASRYEKHVK